MKFKYIVLIIFSIILFSSFVIADGEDTYKDNMILFYSFDVENITGTTVIDLTNNINGTCSMDSNCDTVPSKLKNGSDFDGVDDVIRIPQKVGYDGLTYATWNIILKKPVASGDGQIFSKYDGGGTTYGSWFVYLDTNNKINLWVITGTGNSGTWTTDASINDTTNFNLLTIKYDNTQGTKVNKAIFKYNNQVLPHTFTEVGIFNGMRTGTRDMLISENTFSQMTLDQLSMHNRLTTEAEDLYLYNNGFFINPYIIINNFTITTKNKWNNSNLINFSALVNGTLYNDLGTGTITTGILDTNTNLFNITIIKDDYFNQTFLNVNASINNSVEGLIYQSIINFDCNEKITGFSLMCINSTIYPNSGIYNFSVSVNSYYNVIQNENISVLDNKTIIFNDFYSTNLTLINNFINGAGTNLTNCSYDITGITYPSYSETLNGLNGTIVGLINGTYNIIADCPNYAYESQNVTINLTAQSITFNLYTTNSISISIFDEQTGNPITENITVTKILGITQQENITNTSFINYQNLTAGNYSFTFENENYPKRNYNIVIGNKTYQTLSVYLLANNSNSVIFTLYKGSSSSILQDVVISVSRYINDTLTLLTALNTDITGKIQFYYDIGAKYCFHTEKLNYDDKDFCLDPIIFDSYNVFLVESITLSNDQEYNSILIDFEPTSYYNNQNNTIIFTFASPNGELELYGFNATYKGVTLSNSGSNAYGSILSKVYYISNATFSDQIIIEYYYKFTTGTIKTYKRIYNILGYNSTDNNFMNIRSKDYGLGDFEKVLIVVLSVLLVVGLGSYYSGLEAGGVMGAFVMAYFIYIGLINQWVGLLSIISIIGVIMWRGLE